jgi:hypothetical protein
VLGTLSAAGALVKRFEKIRFPPNVDNCVETMCTVPICFVDQVESQITTRRNPRGTHVETCASTGLI